MKPRWGVFGGEWHSDFSFLTHPPKLSVLYAKEVPAVGGDTLWANMSEAYRRLPSEKKQWLTTQSVVHTGAPYGVINAPGRGSTVYRVHRDCPQQPGSGSGDFASGGVHPS